MQVRASSQLDTEGKPSAVWRPGVFAQVAESILRYYYQILILGVLSNLSSQPSLLYLDGKRQGYSHNCR